MKLLSRHERRSRSFTAGFTLTEVLTVLAIMIILSAIGMETMATFKQRQESQSAVSGLVSLLEDARARTLGSLEDVAYGVFVGSDNAHLFKTTATSTAIGGTVTFPGTSIVTVTLSSGGNTVAFNRLTGDTANDGTISMAYAGTTTTITVHKTGVIEAY